MTDIKIGMTEPKVKTFGWKRKIGSQISKAASATFEQQAKGEDDESVENGDVDWLTLVPVKKKFTIGLEDGHAKSHRLVQEGTILASSERYWEAIKKWDEALQYTPANEKIHEMKSQAMMELCEVYPAIQAAKKAVELAPTWWIAHQTLGRAYLGMGEVRMAVQSFSRAVHLNPENRELWTEDLLWAYSLLQRRETMESDRQKQSVQNQTNTGPKVVELDGYSGDDLVDGSEVVGRSRNTIVDVYKPSETEIQRESCMIIGKLPQNYVQMRDFLPP